MLNHLLYVICQSHVLDTTIITPVISTAWSVLSIIIVFSFIIGYFHENNEIWLYKNS